VRLVFSRGSIVVHLRLELLLELLEAEMRDRGGLITSRSALRYLMTRISREFSRGGGGASTSVSCTSLKTLRILDPSMPSTGLRNRPINRTCCFPVRIWTPVLLGVICVEASVQLDVLRPYPAWGRGTPFRFFSSFVHLLFPILFFLPYPFSFSYSHYLFFVHPFPFYQNRPIVSRP